MKRTSRIEMDTPILPDVIARSVHEEAGVWLKRPLPRRWIRELAARANTVYTRNERFRRQLRGGSNRGRDYLWKFMRHWLAGLLWERRPHLHARLPASYNIGHPLPPQPTEPLEVKRFCRWTARIRPRPRVRPDFAWAAAAHFHTV